MVGAILYDTACWSSRLWLVGANRLNKRILKASTVEEAESDNPTMLSKDNTEQHFKPTQ